MPWNWKTRQNGSMVVHAPKSKGRFGWSPRLLRIWASYSTSRRQRSVSLGESFCFFISFTAVLIPLYSAKKATPNFPEPIGSLEVLFSSNGQISQRASSRFFFWSGIVVVARRVDLSTLDNLLKMQGWSSSLVEISGLFLLSDIFIICWPLLHLRPSCTPLWRPSFSVCLWRILTTFVDSVFVW